MRERILVTPRSLTMAPHPDVEQLRQIGWEIVYSTPGATTCCRKKRIAGNFSLKEAIAIAQRIGAKTMIAHHYGMSAFNTADPEAIDHAAMTLMSPRLSRAQTGVIYDLRPSRKPA